MSQLTNYLKLRAVAFSALALVGLTGVTAAQAGANTVSYQPSTTYTVPGGGAAGLSGVTSSDFDGDGDKDVAVSAEDSHSVFIYLNDGSGVFTHDPTRTFSLLGRPTSIRAANMDGQPGVDLVVGLLNGDIEVRSNDGAGNFPSTPRMAHTVPTARSAIIDLDIADVDLDHQNDIYATAVGARDSYVILNMSGSYVVSTARFRLSDPTAGSFVELNSSDTQPSLLNTSSASDELFAMRSGTGTLQRISVGAKPTDLGVGNFDATDGTDVVVANKNDNNIQLVNNDGTGALTAGSTTAVSQGPNSLSVSDIDADGDDDVAVASENGDVSLLRNDAGTFTASAVFNTGGPATKVRFGLFDGDTAADIVAINPVDGTLTVSLGVSTPEEVLAVESVDAGAATSTETTSSTPTSTIAKIAGRFSLSVKKKLTLSKSRKLSLKVKIDRAGTVKSSATITIGKKKYKVSSRNKSLTKTSFATTYLKVSTKTAKAVRKALKAKKKVKIKIKSSATNDGLTAKSSSGASSISKSVRITKSRF